MENERFEVTDDLRAKWAADRIREKRTELARLKRWYDMQYASAEAHTISEISRLEGLLFEYFQQVPRHKTKTGIEKYKFPGGELVLTPASAGTAGQTVCQADGRNGQGVRRREKGRNPGIVKKSQAMVIRRWGW